MVLSSLAAIVNEAELRASALQCTLLFIVRRYLLMEVRYRKS